MAVPTSPNAGRSTRASASARNAAEWFRQLDHLVLTARSLGAGSPQVEQQIERLAEAFASLVEFHAPLVLRISPLEIWLRDELVVRGPEGDQQHEPIERRLPFILYRDGIRGISVDAKASRQDARTLVEAIARVVGAPSSDDDLVTLLWTADLDGLRVEVAPLEPPSLALAGENAHDPEEAETPPAGAGEATIAEEHAPGDALAAWRELQKDAPAQLAAWREGWREESAHCWPERVEEFVERVLAVDGGPVAREALTRALVNWLSSATQRTDWNEAALAWDSVRRVDPDRQWSDPRIATALASLDAESVADRLDESERDAPARFFALAVRVGRPALDLVVRVLGRSSRQRVRAAATAALGYICADDPRALAPYLRDTRWHVARNVVFTLGQVGGENAGEMLGSAMRHPDLRVRRAAVNALGQVPLHRRTPLLVQQLDGRDPTSLAIVLAMLTREPDSRAIQALVDRIGSADFESRPENERVWLIAALGEIANDTVLPVMEGMLHTGGWFARRTPERTAVAQAIAQVGTPAAFQVLHDGLRARAEAVRTACLEALGGKEKTA